MSKIQSRLSKLIDNISQDFSLEKLSKSPARFDTQKLTWFNRQYIQMMSLDEFVTRAFELKLSAKSKEKNLRVGDYVYLVDPKTQRTFVQIMPEEDYVADGLLYHQLGGGRDVGEDSITGLMREVAEETDGKLELDQSKLIPVSTFEMLFGNLSELDNPETGLPEMYDGKAHHVYYYEIDESEVPPLINNEREVYEWRELNQVLALNTYLKYPKWKQFCRSNSLKLVEPNEAILRQYLAWQLDKNRVNLLTEIGTESSCITAWQKPTPQEITWKKISKDESLENLKEIQNVIEKLYNSSEFKIQAKQDELLEKVKNEIYFETDRLLESGLVEMASIWENALKKWIADNSKDAGSYFWPLRVALSGRQKSPSPFEILAILDVEEVNNRIDRVLN